MSRCVRHSHARVAPVSRCDMDPCWSVRIELTKSHDGDRARFRRSRRPPIVSYPPTGARRAHVILTINPKRFCERGLLTHRTRPKRVARPDTPRLSLSGGKDCLAMRVSGPTLPSGRHLRCASSSAESRELSCHAVSRAEQAEMYRRARRSLTFKGGWSYSGW